MIPINFSIESFVGDESDDWGYHYRIIMQANGTSSVLKKSTHTYHGANRAIDEGIEDLAAKLTELLADVNVQG